MSTPKTKAKIELEKEEMRLEEDKHFYHYYEHKEAEARFQDASEDQARKANFAASLKSNKANDIELRKEEIRALRETVAKEKGQRAGGSENGLAVVRERVRNTKDETGSTIKS